MGNLLPSPERRYILVSRGIALLFLAIFVVAAIILKIPMYASSDLLIAFAFVCGFQGVMHGYLWQIFFGVSRSDFEDDADMEAIEDKKTYVDEKMSQLIKRWYIIGSFVALVGQLFLVWYLFI